MNNQKTVFVAGAAGHLGQLIVNELLAKGHKVTALIRGIDGKHAQTAGRFTDQGVNVVEGDIHAPDTYREALKGINSVVSALQGGPDIIIEGQKVLAQAAVEAGVAQFIPSDFSIDLFAIPYGSNAFLDMRRTFDEHLHTLPIAYTHVLNGAFTDVILYPQMGLIDLTKKTIGYWGDGEQKVDFTTMNDTAKVVALVAGNEKYFNQQVEIAGNELTYPELKSAIEKVTGDAFTTTNYGSVAELERIISEKKKDAKSPFEYVFYQYNWGMVSGKAKLHNALTPDELGFTPTTVEAFLREKIQ